MKLRTRENGLASPAFAAETRQKQSVLSGRPVIDAVVVRTVSISTGSQVEKLWFWPNNPGMHELLDRS